MIKVSNGGLNIRKADVPGYTRFGTRGRRLGLDLDVGRFMTSQHPLHVFELLNQKMAAMD